MMIWGSKITVEWLIEAIQACTEGRYPTPLREKEFRKELKARGKEGCLLVYNDTSRNTHKL